MADPIERTHRVHLESPSEPQERESVCWRPWPCADCRRGCTAVGYLNGRHQAGSEVPEGSTDEVIDEIVRREVDWLREWVRSCPHTSEFSKVLPLLDEGSEHTVFLDAPQGDVIKVTRPRTFGEYYYLVNDRMHQANCLPGEYLIRMRLIEKHFGFAPSVLGVTASGQLVSRQKFIAGDPPSQEEVDEFLFNAGLTPIKQKYWLWKGAADDGLEPWIGDARADNFVRATAGIVPIDLRMWWVQTGESITAAKHR